jgi:hypothetical protein
VELGFGGGGSATRGQHTYQCGQTEKGLFLHIVIRFFINLSDCSKLGIFLPIPKRSQDIFVYVHEILRSAQDDKGEERMQDGKIFLKILNGCMNIGFYCYICKRLTDK